MSKQPPPSAEARALAYDTIGFYLEPFLHDSITPAAKDELRDIIADALDRFAERVCKQRVSAETIRCAALVRPSMAFEECVYRETQDNPEFLKSIAHADDFIRLGLAGILRREFREVERAIRYGDSAPAERPAPPQQDTDRPVGGTVERPPDEPLDYIGIDPSPVGYVRLGWACPRDEALRCAGCDTADVVTPDMCGSGHPAYRSQKWIDWAKRPAPVPSDRASTGEQPGGGDAFERACRASYQRLFATDITAPLHKQWELAPERMREDWCAAFRAGLAELSPQPERPNADAAPAIPADPQPETTAAPSSAPPEPLPDCMMPDGAEPCRGYMALLASQGSVETAAFIRGRDAGKHEAALEAKYGPFSPPAAVVDYTERADTLLHDLGIADSHAGAFPGDLRLVTAALSAVASERDRRWEPELLAGRANVKETGVAFRMIRDALAELSPAIPPLKERDVGPPSYIMDAEEIIDGISRAIATAASERDAEIAALKHDIARYQAAASSDEAEAHSAARGQGWAAFRDTVKGRVWNAKQPFAIKDALEIINTHHQARYDRGIV